MGNQDDQASDEDTDRNEGEHMEDAKYRRSL